MKIKKQYYYYYLIIGGAAILVMWHIYNKRRKGFASELPRHPWANEPSWQMIYPHQVGGGEPSSLGSEFVYPHSMISKRRIHEANPVWQPSGGLSV